jgi:hypothetical protein
MSDTPIVRPALTYQEREALHLLRKAMLRKPHMIELIFRELTDGHARELAGNTLVMVQKELTNLLEVNRAFVAAAQSFAEKFPKEEPK